jgi:hypothetical protein
MLVSRWRGRITSVGLAYQFEFLPATTSLLSSTLRRDSPPQRINWCLDQPELEHCRDPPLVASLDRGGPSIGSLSFRVAFNVEDVDDALPNLSSELIPHRQRLHERGAAPVEGLNRATHLVFWLFQNHACPRVWFVKLRREKQGAPGVSIGIPGRPRSMRKTPHHSARGRRDHALAGGGRPGREKGRATCKGWRAQSWRRRAREKRGLLDHALAAVGRPGAAPAQQRVTIPLTVGRQSALQPVRDLMQHFGDMFAAMYDQARSAPLGAAGLGPAA